MPEPKTRNAVDSSSPWYVGKNAADGPVQRAATIVDTHPSEKDGSAKHWRGRMQLLRQRKAVELSNSTAISRTIDESLKR